MGYVEFSGTQATHRARDASKAGDTTGPKHGKTFALVKVTNFCLPQPLLKLNHAVQDGQPNEGQTGFELCINVANVSSILDSIFLAKNWHGMHTFPLQTYLELKHDLVEYCPFFTLLDHGVPTPCC